MSRVAVITGASAGVGRATALELARRGYRLALIARGEEALRATEAEVERAGGEAIGIALDVSDAAAVEAATDEVEARLGPIDVWINNAMIAVLAFTWDTTPEEFRRVTEVNYLGYVNGTLAALRRMRPRDRGTIVQVSSALSYRAIPLQATYCASKHAIRGFTDSLRTELMHSGSAVKVTSVQLPGLDTTQFGWVRARTRGRPRPVAPAYDPAIAARAIAAAAERPRREWWVGGTTVAVIAGNKLAPWLADRYLARTNVDAQQQETALEPGRPDNLFAPLPGPHAIRGGFAGESVKRSPQLELSIHRRGVAAGSAAVAAAAALVLRRRG